MMTEIMNVDEKLKDHEQRLRKVEDLTTELKFSMINLERNQHDLKATMLDTNRSSEKRLMEMMQRNQDSMNRMFDKFFKITNRSLATNDQVKLLNRKEFWYVIVTIATAIVTYLFTT